MAAEPEYPWYRVVQGSTLEQGDLLLGCPRFVIPADATHEGAGIILTRERVDAIVLTQSCDLTGNARRPTSIRSPRGNRSSESTDCDAAADRPVPSAPRGAQVAAPLSQAAGLLSRPRGRVPVVERQRPVARHLPRLRFQQAHAVAPRQL